MPSQERNPIRASRAEAARRRRRGSITILVVVALVLIAMLGTLYLEVARTDRIAILNLTNNNIGPVATAELNFIARILGDDILDNSDHKGTAKDGKPDEIKLDDDASATDDFYNNQIITIVGGTGEGQTRLIIGYKVAGPNKVATISPDWSVIPDATSEFFISPRFFSPADFDEVYDYPWTNDDPAVTFPVTFSDGVTTADAQGGENDDMWLASTAPRFPADLTAGDAVWGHLSNLHGGIYLRLPSATSTIFFPGHDNGSDPVEDRGEDVIDGRTGADAWLHIDSDLKLQFDPCDNLFLGDSDDPGAPANPGRWLPIGADTDGDGVPDARWSWATIRQIEGVSYVVAIRIVDNSARINLNTAAGMTNDGDEQYGEHPIIVADAGLNRFTVFGDQILTFMPGVSFLVTGSTDNDGYYTVVSRTFLDPNTRITVASVTDGTNDGTISMPPRGYFPSSVDLTRLLSREVTAGNPFLGWAEELATNADSLFNLRGVNTSSTGTPFGLINPVTFVLDTQGGAYVGDTGRLGNWLEFGRLYGYSGNKLSLLNDAELHFRGGLNASPLQSESEKRMFTLLRDTANDSSYLSLDYLPFFSLDTGITADHEEIMMAYFQGADNADTTVGNPNLDAVGFRFANIRSFLTTRSGAAVFAANHGDMHTGLRTLKYDLVFQDGGADVDPPDDERVTNMTDLLEKIFTITDDSATTNAYLGLDSATDAALLTQIATEFALAIQDYSDSDSTPSGVTIGATTYFGLETMPFMREVYLQAGYEDHDVDDDDADGDPNTGNFDTWVYKAGSQAIAIEIGNPFDRAIFFATTAANPVLIRVKMGAVELTLDENNFDFFEWDSGTSAWVPITGGDLATKAKLDSRQRAIVYDNPESPVAEFSPIVATPPYAGNRGDNLRDDLGFGDDLGEGRPTLLIKTKIDGTFKSEWTVPLDGSTKTVELQVKDGAAIYRTYDRFDLTGLNFPDASIAHPSGITTIQSPTHAQGAVARDGQEIQYFSNVGKGTSTTAGVRVPIDEDQLDQPTSLGYRFDHQDPGSRNEPRAQLNRDIKEAVSVFGTATTADVAGTTLIDTAANFSAAAPDVVNLGDTVYNVSDGSRGIVTSIDGLNQLTTSALLHGTDNDWGVGDAYRILRNYFQIPMGNRPIFSVAELGWIQMFGFTDQADGDFPQRFSGLGPGAPGADPKETWDSLGRRRLLSFSFSADTVDVPHGALVFDQFTTLSPRNDGVDNDDDDGNGNPANGADNLEEQFVPGTININTVVLPVATLAAPMPEPISEVQAMMSSLLNYRDAPQWTTGTAYIEGNVVQGDGDPDSIIYVCNAAHTSSVGDEPLIASGFWTPRTRQAKGFASIGELLMVNPNQTVPPGGTDYQRDMIRYGEAGEVAQPVEMDLYPMPESEPAPTSAVRYTNQMRAEGELARFQFLSQTFTTRSDIFTAYIYIRGYPSSDFRRGPVESKRLFAIFDRSGLVTGAERVKILGVFEIN